jgi:hypothetical protein
MAQFPIPVAYCSRLTSLSCRIPHLSTQCCCHDTGRHVCNPLCCSALHSLSPSSLTPSTDLGANALHTFSVCVCAKVRPERLCSRCPHSRYRMQINLIAILPVCTVIRDNCLPKPTEVGRVGRRVESKLGDRVDGLSRAYTNIPPSP